MTQTKEKASDRAERLLIEHFIGGTFPPLSDLPGERDLCKTLGVARPALREALQRLSRDGWLIIQQGKPTRVNDFMREGNISVITSLLHANLSLLPGFVPNIVEFWSLMAPTYAFQAVQNNPKLVAQLLYGFRGLDDRPEPTARAQWRMHRALADQCINPVFSLMLNTFGEFYFRVACVYYAHPAFRKEARVMWDGLYQASLSGDAERAAEIVRDYLDQTMQRWPELNIERDLEHAIEAESNNDE